VGRIVKENLLLSSTPEAHVWFVGGGAGPSGQSALYFHRGYLGVTTTPTI